MELILDQSAAKKRMEPALRELFSAESSPKLAISYVTSDVNELLGLPGTVTGTLICDPFGGGCKPEVLIQLDDRGWNIYCLAGLHTKVYLSSNSIAIGSPNLSISAIREGNVEALVIIRELSAVAQTHDWFNDLAASAKPFHDIAKSPERLGQIQAAYQARTGQPGHGGQRQQPVGDFLSGKAFWNSYVFSLIDGTNPNHEAALRAAEELDLSKHWTYDETKVEKDGAAQVSKYRRETNGKSVLSLSVRSTSHGHRVTAFKSFEESESMFVDAVHSESVVYCYYKTAPIKRFPFSWKSTADLCAALNRGLKSTGMVLSVFDFIPGQVMAELYRAGLEIEPPIAMKRWKLKRKAPRG